MRVDERQRLTLMSAPPHEYQRRFMALPSYDGWEGIHEAHAMAGRAGGKTRALVLDVFQYVAQVNPGYPVYVSEPSGSDTYTIFFRAWKEMIPQSLWTSRESKGIIMITLPFGRRRKNGEWSPSTIDLISRHSDNERKDPGRGPEYAAGWDDELAKDKSRMKRHTLKAAIRLGNFKLHKSATTPRLGWYRRMIAEKQEHDPDSVITWSSYDNPYLDRAYVTSLEEDYSPELRAQEVEAKFVSLMGRIWQGYDDGNYWPHGNKHWHRYDDNRPWILGMDIGSASGAFLAVQAVDPITPEGRRIGDRPLIVAVAEWTPSGNEGAGIDQVINKIKTWTDRPPSKVILGGDVHTRSSNDLRTGADFISEHYPNVPVHGVTPKEASKSRQHALLSRLILNTKGQRRFCISDNLYRANPSQYRGIRDVMLEDAWPDGTKNTLDFLPKENRYEHMRDAALYLATAITPPNAATKLAYAA